MNIDDLTYGQLKEIAAMFGTTNVVNTTTSPSTHGLTGQKVIVRASAAGVHYGELVSIEGDTVTLKNARRLWYWVVDGKKGVSLSDVAEHGVSSDSKVCATVPTHIVLSVAEVMTTSETAQKKIEGANVYNP